MFKKKLLPTLLLLSGTLIIPVTQTSAKQIDIVNKKEIYTAPVDTSKPIVETWKIGASDPDDVIATFYEDGELRITGKGDANPSGNKPGRYAGWDIPWQVDKSIRNSIKKVSMESTVIPRSMATWFLNCTNLTDISDLHCSPGIYNMDSTFQNCKNLTDISDLTIPDTVEIMDSTFCDTGIKNIPSSFKIPSSVSSAEMLFAWSDLETAENFIVPSTLKNADLMFWNCSNLKNVNGLTIESGVDSAFRFLGSSRAAEGTITVKSNLKEYDLFFESASGNGNGLVVNYTAESKGIIDKLLKTANQYNSNGEITLAGKVNKGTMIQ